MRTTENEQHYSTRERQTLIYKFLLENSNKNKAVATQWIKDYLDTFDIKTHINTLYADLKEIELTYGVTIEYDQKKKGYKLTDTLFEPYEIQLIAQSLQAFKYISNSKASDITEKLKTLTDNDTAATLNSVGINAVDRIHRQSDSILTQVKRIEKAIQEDKKIRIKYKTGRRYFIMLCGTKNETPSSRAKTRISKESYVDNGYIISPYHLYWKNGDLHLIAGLLVDEDGNPESKAVNFASFRVDKLCIISKPLDMPRDGNNEYEELKRKFKGKREFDFDELMGREIKQVKMQFFFTCEDEVLDKFGNDAVLVYTVKSRFTTTQPVVLNAKFYAWMASFGNQAKILWPEEAVQGMKKYLSVVCGVYKDDGET